MLIKFKKILKAAIKSIIVAFLFVMVIGVSAIAIGKEEIAMVSYALQVVSSKVEKVEKIEPVLDSIVEKWYTQLLQYEKSNIDSVDMAADPFGQMLPLRWRYLQYLPDQGSSAGMRRLPPFSLPS